MEKKDLLLDLTFVEEKQTLCFVRRPGFIREVLEVYDEDQLGFRQKLLMIVSKCDNLLQSFERDMGREPSSNVSHSEGAARGHAAGHLQVPNRRLRAVHPLSGV